MTAARIRRNPGVSSTGTAQGCTTGVRTAPPNNMANPVTIIEPHLASTLTGISVYKANATADTMPQKHPCWDSANRERSPCVAIRTSPAMANTSPSTSRGLGSRRLRKHVHSMMSTKPSCSMVVPTPALV